MQNLATTAQTPTMTVQVVDGTRSGALADVMIFEAEVGVENSLGEIKSYALRGARRRGFGHLTSAGVGTIKAIEGGWVEVVLTEG